jgi:hypothetical protein
MIDAVSFPLLGRTRTVNARMAVPRTGNVRSDNGLQDKSGAGERRRDRATPESRTATLSRFETEYASNRHGVRQSTPFVAQIMGQMLGKNTIDAASARVAYANIAETAPSGIRYDRRA